MISPLAFANPGEDIELQSPVFDDPAEGLAYMDEQAARVVAELEAEARERMQLDAEDPSQQNYYMRTDKLTVVKDEQEYVGCLRHGVKMKIVTYAHALQLLKDEDARFRQKQKDKRKKKTLKAARKKNRKR